VIFNPPFKVEMGAEKDMVLIGADTYSKDAKIRVFLAKKREGGM